MRTRRQGLAAVLALVLSFSATPVLAQAWRGVPLDSLELGVGLNAAFPESSDMYGAEVFKHLGLLTVGGEYALTTFEGEDVSSAHKIGVNAALGLGLAPLDDLGIRLSPVAGAAYNTWDDVSWIEVPVGPAVSLRLPVGDGLSIVPFAIPQFVWSRFSADDETGESQSESNSDFGFTAGGNLVVNNLFFGGSYRKVGDFDGTVGINVGILLR
jgi:hypothetical protein